MGVSRPIQRLTALFSESNNPVVSIGFIGLATDYALAWSALRYANVTAAQMALADFLLMRRFTA